MKSRAINLLARWETMRTKITLSISDFDESIKILDGRTEELKYMKRVTESVLSMPAKGLYNIMLQRYIKLQHGTKAIAELNDEGYRIKSERSGNPRKLEANDIKNTMNDKELEIDPQIRKLAQHIYDCNRSTMTFNAIMKGYKDVEKAGEKRQ